ncbi:hypothetical protein [Verrucosispora sioxanthis]|uniref:hypothetical protein n=1 Tax=Verrucosispora sioxanthis TaxID=2499994 RepID=UPI002814A270|nr:hypothetical protein [Verrucosispora sioxanthis]
MPDPGVTGRLPVAPLIVDGRLRVYAAPRQVYADQPVDSRSRRTPYWSFRRWPASLDAVVASGTTVVSRWSDGQLVAIDARTGRVAWRAAGPEPAAERVARRSTWPMADGCGGRRCAPAAGSRWVPARVVGC